MPEFAPTSRKRRRIAVVGGGVSGISCLWTLRHGHDYEVHLFEAETCLGGHAHTVPFQNNGVLVNVDTGFISMNDETYPEFSEFLKQLDVATIPTDMSFGVSVNEGQLEWGSGSFRAFLGTWSNAFRPWFWRLCFDILRFNVTCTDIIKDSRSYHSLNVGHGPISDKNCLWPQLESIGGYLDRLNYSKQFALLYLIPMVAAPWCIDPTTFSRDFPAKFLIEFMANHRLLDTVWHTLQWRTFPSGTKSYIDAFLKTLPTNHHLHLGTRVNQLRRHPNDRVTIYTENAKSDEFDHVILAIHAPQALAILGEEASALERKILGAFKTSKNICVLHSDSSLLPRRLNARSSWNCLLEKPAAARGQMDDADIAALPISNHHKIAITFDMNRLQRFHLTDNTGSLGNVLVTMNSPRPISSPSGTFEYYHPLFSSDSVQASKQLRHINGVRGVSFAGAWMGYGFHEDGFSAGASAARELLLKDSIVVNDAPPKMSHAGENIRDRNKWIIALVHFIQLFIDLSTYLWAGQS